MTSSRYGTRGPPAAIAVAVDGTPADRAVLCWAAEKAEHDRRPVLVAHAVGHLPPELTYGERRIAREQVKARGAVLAERAARFVHRHAPSVTVSTVVRLLDPDALLPTIAGEASAVIRVAPAWHGSDGRPPELVVAAIGDAMTDAHVVWFASDFAARHGNYPGAMERGAPDGAEHVPQLRLDDLLSQLIDRAQEALRTQHRLRKLIAANDAVVGDLDLPTVLRRIVEAACELVGAQYGALGVIAPDGDGLEEFVHVGMDDAVARRIGHLPQGKGLLGALIDDPHPIRLERIGHDARSVGFPNGHPPMESFLGVPVRVRDEVFGNLYLSNTSARQFDEDDEALVLSLAATAGVAIDNARLFQQSRRRQDWLEASAEVTRQVLAPDDQGAVQTIIATVRRLADAQVVILLEPTGDGSAASVLAAGGGDAERLVGGTFPSAGTASGAVLESGEPVLLECDEEGRVEGSLLAEVVSVGPVMLVPLAGTGRVRGVLMAGRRLGSRRFSEVDLEMAATFATHASLALELADARLDQERMARLEDRTRIAQDLHDHVIQQLFAAGMTVQGVAVGMGDQPRAQMLDKVVDTLDDAVKQIRTSIFQLRPHIRGGSSLRAALLDAVTDVVPALGFEPRVTFDGPVDAVSDEDLSADVLAVVREALANTAKHARASTATVHLHATATGLDATVADNGTGLTGTRRSGLANLRDRATRRGGSLLINEPPPDSGTRLVWSVPFS